MSTPQRTHAGVKLAVDRATADVLRLEAKKILMFGHEPFEDLLDYGPEAQYALAMSFQDAIELVTAVGWDPDSRTAKADRFDINLTHDLVQELTHRRVDLGATNLDRLDDVEEDEPIAADLMAEITADRNAAATLDRVIATYTTTVAHRRS